MADNMGQVAEVRAGGWGRPDRRFQGAFIACDPELIPFPGEYLQAAPVAATGGLPGSVVLAEILFRGLAPSEPGSPSRAGFWAAAPLPPDWSPGLRLQLRGPLGNGFRPPEDAGRLALINAEGGAGPLLALAEAALEKDCSVVFFGDTVESSALPAEVESYPFESLQEMGGWADRLAVAIPLGRLSELNKILGFSAMSRAPMPVEVLVRSPMPCAGRGKCGVCAFQRGGKWILACEDGPVIRYGP